MFNTISHSKNLNFPVSTIRNAQIFFFANTTRIVCIVLNKKEKFNLGSTSCKLGKVSFIWNMKPLKHDKLAERCERDYHELCTLQNDNG